MVTAAQPQAAPAPAPAPSPAPPAPRGADLAEPYLSGHLASLGLAVEYVRAEGNTLYHLDDDGAEVAVLDLVGGFGATILGHNHPEIVSRAKDLLDRNAPVFAQFSLHPYAHDVARTLNAIVRRESGDPEPYLAIFANSGAEAIEAAVKHAELDRVLKVAELTEAIEAETEAVRAASGRGTVAVPDDVRERLGLRPPAAGAAGGTTDGVAGGTEGGTTDRVSGGTEDGATDGVAGGTRDGATDGVAGGTRDDAVAVPVDALAEAVLTANSALAQSPPVLLALEGSFHGKLVGSVQLTHNAAFREPFGALAARCRFVPFGRPEALDEIVAAERRTLFGLAVEDGRVRLTEHELPVFCAFVLEPVQGEGGIRPLDEEFARRIRETCDAIGCPVVVDEIQSGMGRTGTFLASSALGLRGDYYALGKSLGGGIAKAAVTLVRESRYRARFEMAHSSTFAKDGFSTLIAARTLELLEADGGGAYRRAEERGRQLTATLDAVHRDFPDVVKEVRGRGLMVGLELHDPSGSPDPGIREHALSGTFGYAASGYLLRAHAVRIFPTASAPTTLRFAPSVYLTDAEIDHAGAALRGLCAVLRAHDGARLLGSGDTPSGSRDDLTGEGQDR
ncbi:aspartate aminotransferase family protein [Streptomyces corynorhini]|uniref:Aminotransferase class III-fold pyridoxal phosphate-dependent enzyme n=1 Tax=Streptomyces corynorhini TaxID=2282652 RepID=A0A370AYH3_9ACTN|nr:aminotransferase class III-fold pyridoxal phosphate-dependent enzyme [Streptomyces corynorhini]RDG34638.1 aminotransferase class III-fold pyridoxal phosphate-dependent enzyme [Streptomyces corynorhini]